MTKTRRVEILVLKYSVMTPIMYTTELTLDLCIVVNLMVCGVNIYICIESVHFSSRYPVISPKM